MQIPYVQALGEGDEECVSLANHLDCYLIATDSDYYCYNLYRGYISFDYLKLEPKRSKNNYKYLSAWSYNVKSLLNHFDGLDTSTLALACCLCGNDYIQTKVTGRLLDHISTEVDKRNIPYISKNKTTHWYTMQWLRHYPDVEQAIDRLLAIINVKSERIELNDKLRAALQCYLNPSDTLIYRFRSEKNQNLKKDKHFVQLAEGYLTGLKKVTYTFLLICFFSLLTNLEY